MSVRQNLLYAVYSGNAFFAAAVAVAAVIVLDLAIILERKPLIKRIAGLFLLIAIAIGVLASPPLPVVSGAILLLTTLTYAFAGFGSRRRYLAVVTLGVLLLVAGQELRHQFVRNAVEKPAHLLVIGDSISSGGFGEMRAWPEVLGAASSVRVTNLSLASADAAMAVQRQLRDLPPPAAGQCVIVAIGGNDMLSGAPSDEFERNFETIIRKAAERPCVVVLETPVLPGRWIYARVQRRVAARYDAVLVPRRVTVGALAPAANTFDGVHLTQRGHDALAMRLREQLRW